MKIKLVFILLFSSVVVYGQMRNVQVKQIDSLKAMLNKPQSDSMRAKIYTHISAGYWHVDNVQSIDWGNKAIKLCKEKKLYNILAYAYDNAGMAYVYLAKYDSGLVYIKKSLHYSKKYTAESHYAKVTNNLGVCYYYMGKYVEAANTWIKAFKLQEKIGNKLDQAQLLNNIGVVLYMQDNLEKAIDYYEKALSLKLELKDTLGSASTLQNLGNIYQKLDKPQKALNNYLQALELYEIEKSNGGIASANLSIGEVKDFFLGQSKEAEKHYLTSLKLSEIANDPNGVALANVRLGMLYVSQKQYKKATEYIELGAVQSKEVGNLQWQSEAYEFAAEMYSQLGQFQKAFTYQRLFSEISDSLVGSQNRDRIADIEAKYQNEKKELEITNLNKDKKLKDTELAKQRAEVKKQNIQKIAFASGFGLMLVLAFVVFRSYRQKKRDNDVITLQKHIVEEKNKEILDSINYAKRIQNAILPPDKVVKEYLNESFILYKPKDIVAGDFYWMEHKEGKVLFAAADCTGHGVPGAMVSVVCNNGLNRSVREYGLTDPGQILDKTREIVVQEFEKSEEDVKDGMDIALCSLEGKKLQYAGANNPLWIIRNGEIIETKANKQPIGKFDNPLPYNTHSFELIKGDTFYLFSDGYVDQFGGENGKKFKARAFKKLLLSIQSKSLIEQKVLIDQTFESWKGDLEQIDDVCVIGVRV